MKVTKKVLDAIFGSPKAHNIQVKPNRKQKRVQAALRQKQLSAPKRKKHEKRR